jgi:hypothetical protein
MTQAPSEARVEINPKDLIEGLVKGLRVIEAFDDECPRLTPSQTAALCGITRTAARRHLLTLVHLGYAGTDGKLFWARVSWRRRACRAWCSPSSSSCRSRPARR